MKSLRNASSRLFDALLRNTELTPPTDRLLLRALFFVIIFSGVWYIHTLNEQHSTDTPVSGGILREGIIGTPRFVNPALANTRADQDMAALIYSGLMKIAPSGELVPDLAESVTVSDDGIVYNVVLRQDIYFHDGHPVTTEDIAYTIGLFQDPDLKSPLRGSWTDVIVEELSDNEFNIVLDEAYSPFIENFTVGILPAHLWSSLPIEQISFSQLNTEPVGSGPFKLQTAQRDPSGVIEGYVLERNQDRPRQSNIEELQVLFFESEESLITAFGDGLLDASAYVSNERIDEVESLSPYDVVRKPLPRVFAVFLNQNRSSALRDEAVREALSVAVDRDEIISANLFGQGVPMNGPVTQTLNEVESEERSGESTGDPTEDAIAILEDAGWRQNNQGSLEKQIDGETETLEITLRTSNAPLFIGVSRNIERAWEAIGVNVTIDQYEQTGLIQSVIRPRNFEALLFGLDKNRSQDLYPFWHSSQQDDPGLNIAQYTNLTVDELLEDARTEQNIETRNQLLQDAASTIESEYPAVFLFQPVTTYVVNSDFILTDMEELGRPSDRFSNISEWYTTSERLWNVFR